MHVRLDQYRDYSESLCKVSHYSIKLCFLCLVFSEHPRCLFINVFIGTSDEYPYLLKRHVELELIHFLRHSVSCRSSKSYEFVVDLISCSCSRNDSSAVLLDHADRSGEQVAEVVCQVEVHSFQHYFICEDAVLSECVLTEQEILECVNAVAVYQYYRIDYILSLCSL